MTSFARIRTPIGTLLATAEGDTLTGLYFEASLRNCARQIADYLAGKRHDFDLPVAPSGTAFQRRVWREIARIPYGSTISYAELAKRAGAPGSARAAGAATGRNPLSIIVPCHRVVGSRGSLTGYAGGLERKARLLRLEGVAA